MALIYKADKNNPTAFICVDITHKIEDASIKSIVINLADYTLHNLLDHGHDVYVTRDDIDETIREVSNRYSHAVVFTNDTEFEGSAFFKNLIRLVQRDFFLVGHILDRKNAYYELHDQCFVVNLEKYKELGYPNLGGWRLNHQHTQMEPQRSEENFHHEHTPKSVRPGFVERDYAHQCFGYKWISKALKNNQPIEIFDDEMRGSKRNYYAKYADEFHKNFSHYQLKHDFSLTKLFYPINTEKFDKPLVKKLRQLVLPASGLNFLRYLDSCQLTEETEVVFYDSSKHSLNMMRKVIETFDGNDYLEFLNNNCSGILSSSEAITENWNKINHLWPLANNVSYRYENVDIMYEIPKNMQNENTILHVSNVFAYEPNVAFRSLSHRILSFNRMINELQKKHNDVNIIASAYPEQAFTITPSTNSFVKNVKQVELHNLDVAIWNEENDVYKRPIRNTPA
jgi:hypothetical protein